MAHAAGVRILASVIVISLPLPVFAQEHGFVTLGVGSYRVGLTNKPLEANAGVEFKPTPFVGVAPQVFFRTDLSPQGEPSGALGLSFNGYLHPFPHSRARPFVGWGLTLISAGGRGTNVALGCDFGSGHGVNLRIGLEVYPGVANQHAGAWLITAGAAVSKH
jgi:hypothetical protein